MEVIIKAGAKEIASLVLELQGKREKMMSVSAPKAQTPEERERLARSIEEVLLAQSQGGEKDE